MESALAGITLDDFLWHIDETRRAFGLGPLRRGPVISGRPADRCMRELIDLTVERYGETICAKRHPILDGIGTAVYLKEFENEVYRGWLISPSHVRTALRRVLEASIRTIIELPSKRPRARSRPKSSQAVLKDAVAHLTKVAEELQTLLTGRQSDEAGRRLAHFFAGSGSEELGRLQCVPKTMLWAADRLHDVSARTHLVTLKSDSSNPQVAFAMRVLFWLRTCTGQECHARLAELVSDAFRAAGRPQGPKWVGRLGREAFDHRNRRAKLAKSLTTEAPHRPK